LSYSYVDSIENKVAKDTKIKPSFQQKNGVKNNTREINRLACPFWKSNCFCTSGNYEDECKFGLFYANKTKKESENIQGVLYEGSNRKRCFIILNNLIISFKTFILN
jgi:hypothetical protein